VINNFLKRKTPRQIHRGILSPAVIAENKNSDALIRKKKLKYEPQNQMLKYL